MTRKKILSILIPICAVVVTLIMCLAPKTVKAAAPKYSIMQKAVMQALHNLYSDGSMSGVSYTLQQSAEREFGLNTGVSFYTVHLPPVYFNDKSNEGAVNAYTFIEGEETNLKLVGAVKYLSGGTKSTTGTNNQEREQFSNGMGFEAPPATTEDVMELCFRPYYMEDFIIWAESSSDGLKNYMSAVISTGNIFGPIWQAYTTSSQYGIMHVGQPLCANVTITNDGSDGSEMDGIIAENARRTSNNLDYNNGETVIQFETLTPGIVRLDCATMNTYWNYSIKGSLAATLQGSEFVPPFPWWTADSCKDDDVAPAQYTVGQTKFSDIRDILMSTLIEKAGEFEVPSTNGVSHYYIQTSYYDQDGVPIYGGITSTAEETRQFSLRTDDTNFNIGTSVLKYLTGDTSLTYSTLQLSGAETMVLYSNYIRNFYGLVGDPLPEDTTLNTDGYRLVKLLNLDGDKKGQIEKVYVKVNNPERSVIGIRRATSSQTYVGAEELGHLKDMVDFSGIADWLASYTGPMTVDLDLIDTNQQTSGTVPEDPSGGEEGSTGEHEPSCYDNAGSLGWVVCPIIDGVADFIIDKYERWVEPALQINTKLFGGEGSETYTVWNVFRNIANIAFAIVFLIIIFSQLTGVGIDNYGIKKILPKLIIGAILINLSYIICQLAIDLANILGYGVAGIFKGIASEIQIPETLTIDGVSASTQPNMMEAGGGLTLVVIGIVAAISTLAVLSQGTAIIIPILMAVVGVAISLFTLIAILAMRQAAAVLLVVASPLAFVAYMLPNTKKLFDKWFTVFKGLLIAFPACSALIYGGDLVGRILVTTSSGSTWITLSAAIVSIAPIFFIPKLIKSSMGAVSTIASNLAGRGSKLAGNAIGGSQWAKNVRGNHEARKQFRNTMRQSGYRFDKEGKPTGRSLRGLLQDALPHTKAGAAQIARSRAAASREGIEAYNAGRLLGSQAQSKFAAAFDTNKVKQESQDIQDEISRMVNEDSNMASVYVRDASGNITEGGLSTAFDQMMTEGVTDKNRLRFQAVVASLATSADGQKYISKRLGGKDANGNNVTNDRSAIEALSDVAMRNGGEIKEKLRTGKSTFAASFLQDAAAKNSAGERTGELDYGKYLEQNGAKITADQLDKNNLYDQGGDDFARAINYKDSDGNYVIDHERLLRDLGNPNLQIDVKKREAISKRLAAEGVEAADYLGIPHGDAASSSAPAPAQQQAAPAQQQAAPAPAQTTAPQQVSGLGPRARLDESNKRAQAVLDNQRSGPRARQEAQETINRNNSAMPQK